MKPARAPSAGSGVPLNLVLALVALAAGAAALVTVALLAVNALD
jgi:hypothetical protein